MPPRRAVTAQSTDLQIHSFTSSLPSLTIFVDLSHERRPFSGIPCVARKTGLELELELLLLGRSAGELPFTDGLPFMEVEVPLVRVASLIDCGYPVASIWAEPEPEPDPRDCVDAIVSCTRP